MDWRYAALYFGLALVTLHRAWRTKSRPMAWAFVANVVWTNLTLGLVLPKEATTTVNALGEIVSILVAAVCLLNASRIAGVVIALSTTSCIVSLSYSIVTDKSALNVYEACVNVILLAQMVIVGGTRLWGVVASGIGRFVRWHRYRRRAADAGLRARMASGAPYRRPHGVFALFRRSR